MIKGADKFIKKFKKYSNCYTVIGGSACDILLSEQNLNFRETKDIDMIIIFEDKYTEFAKEFWEFIKEGGYKCGWRNNEAPHFYRFTEPNIGYPKMIELFSRTPDYHLEIKDNVVPIYIDDDISSLSALLLNDDFYDFMLQGRTVKNGICILSAEYLIPFKMYAWLDLTSKKKNGKKAKSSDIKKHKYDVFRLLQIVTLDKQIYTKGLVHSSIVNFINCMENEYLPLNQIGLDITKQEGISILKELYNIN